MSDIKCIKFFVIILITAILAFLYGVLTVHYRIFPFNWLSQINGLLIVEDHRSVYFHHKKSFFDLHGQSNYDIVFVGDSITDHADWSDLFPTLTIANRGISGDTTGGVLERMDSIISTQASQAYIMIGVNDFLRGSDVETVYANYQNIVDQFRHEEMPVTIQSTLLTGKRYSHLSSRIARLNAELEVYASEQEGVRYIDLNALLASNGVLDEQYSLDGVHLNGEGYARWQAALTDFLLQ